ncbi:MAG: hypothetical protein NC908_03295 [Candidatus Omnitrophica bacterium]|nr:hypothetical protein [Candidatus Omnitrophota bacterium]
MFKKNIQIALLCFLVILYYASLYAESPDETEGKADILEGKLAQEKIKIEVLPIEISLKEKIEQVRPKPVLPEEKIKIKEIIVLGNTVLSSKEIRAILGSFFYNRQLSGKEMQRCADQINDWYSLNGYLTSYAYVEPSRLNEGILQIQCVEGKIGDIKIEGNRYFSTNVYMKRSGVNKGDIFNFKQIKNNIYRTNKHPDRKVTINIKPRENLEYTDIVLSVKDKLPLHFVFDHDNYGSEYILYKRYKNTFVFNNFTGRDDVLNIKAQFCEADAQRLFDLDYFLPINNTWKWELYYMPFKRENYYYGDNEQRGFEKRAYKWYTYLYQTIFSEPNRELVFNYGFVQKFISWYVRKEKQKADRFCALLWGFDYMRADDYGTWVVSEDLEKGIPRMFGASTAEDGSCSVKGAGGKYLKQKLAIARRQKLPWFGIEMLTKAQMQYSTQAMTGVNVFSVGGYMGTIDNRGYPRAQMPMDSGFYLMGGFSFPAYFIPKDLNIPFTQNKAYSNLKFFNFFEYAKGYKRSCKTAAEKVGELYDPDTSSKTDDVKRKSLKSAGWGFAFNIPEHSLSMRFDMAWPLNHKIPKDGSHRHTWYRVTKNF